MLSDDKLIEQINCGDEQAVEDLTHETFYKLFKIYPDIKGKDMFRGIF